MSDTTPLDLVVTWDRWREIAWADVDPQQALAPDRERAVELAVEALMDTPRDGDELDWMRRTEDEIARRFAHAWGPWTCGWRYASATDGGVTIWPTWSLDRVMPRGQYNNPRHTANVAATALTQWHAWLRELAALFAKLDVVGKVDVSASALASAAARIVDVVVERTEAEDAWYRTCEQALRWFLEHQGIDPAATRVLVGQAIGGIFHSWTPPAEHVRQRVASTVGNRAVTVLRGDDG